MIAIVDYGVGNIFSLRSSLAALAQDVVLTADADVLASASGIILPGVGAFADARAKLAATGLDRVLVDLAAGGAGKPLLGICLGMQMLFDESLEFGRYEGLGLVPGRVVPMRGVVPDNFALPQIGWNALAYTDGGCGARAGANAGAAEGVCVGEGVCEGTARGGRLLATTPEGAYVYFVHSYFATDCAAHTTAVTDYGAPVTATVERGNVFGCQFHPEKSGRVGLEILRRFCELAEKEA